MKGKVDLQITGMIDFDGEEQVPLFVTESEEPITEPQLYRLRNLLGNVPLDLSRLTKKVAQSLIGNNIVYEKARQADRRMMEPPPDVQETLNTMNAEPLPWEAPVENEPVKKKRGRPKKLF